MCRMDPGNLPVKLARHRRGRPRVPVSERSLAQCRAAGRLVAELCRADVQMPTPCAEAQTITHVRQVGMYIAHVILSIPYGTIAIAFGKDRTTVAHACRVVEERRDAQEYDRFIEFCERCVSAALLAGEGTLDG